MRHRKFQGKPERQSLLREAPGIIAGSVAIGAVGYYSAGDLISSIAATAQGRNINGNGNGNGNVSVNSREQIYHVPGQEYYSATKISPEYGERWFCSEQEAMSAGSRKAGR